MRQEREIGIAFCTTREFWVVDRVEIGEINRLFAGKLVFKLPFAVVSCHKEVLFCEKSVKETAGLLNYILSSVIPSEGGEFEYEGRVIFKEKLAVYGLDDIYVAYVKEGGNLLILRHFHDIYAPLRNIANFLQLIRDNMFEDRETATCYINYALNSISKLLSFSKEYLHNHRKNYHEKVCIKGAVNDVAKMIEAQIKRRNCQLKIGENIPDIYANYSEIVSLFKNLIENSLRYSETDALVIRITKMFSNEKELIIRYEDNGQELREEKKEKIRKNLRPDVAKSGLGLCICKEIAEGLGGKVEFVDETGPGCIFNISLQIERKD